MDSRKPPKKSETIEIRLSLEAKAAFMDRCRDDRRTASDVIRELIETPPAPASSARKRHFAHWRILVAGAIGAAVGAGAAAPALARAAQDSRQSFQQLDSNHDGVLTYAEYRRR